MLTARSDTNLMFRLGLSSVRAAASSYLVPTGLRSLDKALNIYRQKCTVEKSFNNYKDRCGGRRLGYSERALEGKVFVTYLGLTLSLILHKRLQDANIDPERAPRLISELNALTINKFVTDGDATYLWHKIPKRYEDLMKRLKIKIPCPICTI